MSDSLALHGCIQCKSLVLEFPNIAEELVHHFMRGYFDGDGCIWFGDRRAAHFDIVSTEKFLDRYQARLHAVGVSNTKYVPQGRAFSLRHGGINKVRIIYDYLYKDATVFLDRKQMKFALGVGRNTCEQTKT